MNDYQRSYYHEMKNRDRLIPIVENNKVVALITFYIGNGNPSKYVRENMWSVVDDEPNGDTVYIDHLVASGDKDNPYKSLVVWKYIKKYLKDKFPSVRLIRWNRFKGGKVNVYIKNIK